MKTPLIKANSFLKTNLPLAIGIIVVSVFLVLSWVVYASAKYIENVNQPISLEIEGAATNKITYNTKDIAHGEIQGKFHDGLLSKEQEQDFGKRYAVPVLEGTQNVDEPIVDDSSKYIFDYWYSYDSTTNEEKVYKNLNSTMCTEDNWPVENTFYAHYKLKLAITYDATTGWFSDTSKKKIVEQTLGSTFAKPNENPTWEVGISPEPAFAYWYEIDQSGAHIQWDNAKFEQIVSEETMPYNNTLYAEWTSDYFLVTFDAQESLGGYWQDGTATYTQVLIPQSDGSGFVLPENSPLNTTSSKSFTNWNLNKNVDEEATRITSSTIASKATHNHITVYAHYKDSRHRITVLVANPESGGLLNWTNDAGETETGVETYYDAPDTIDGEKLYYSLTSETNDGKLIGTALFSRGLGEDAKTAVVFSSENDASSVVFSRFDIIDEFGNFPGWENAVNCNITIKLYFSPSSYEAYWVGNYTGGEISINSNGKTYSIPNAGMGFYYDNNKELWSNAYPVTRYKYDIENVPVEVTSASDWKYTYMMPSTWKTTCTSIIIDESFIYYPIKSLAYMFQGFSKIGNCNNSFSNIWVFNVSTLSEAFNSCSGLESINLEKWDVRNVTNAYRLFYQCTNTNLKWLNLSNWRFDKCTNYDQMFYGCKYLEHIYVATSNTSWVKTSGVTSNNMFYQCYELHNWISGNTHTILRAYCQDENIATANGGYFETWRGNTN